MVALASTGSSQAQTAAAPPKVYTNELGMKFVWIPPGSFVMGSPKEEKQRNGNEIHHKVTLKKGFYMGVTPVTQEQWTEIMEKSPSMFVGEKNLPVDSVTWNNCQEFAKKLKEKDKKAYRLPSEAEWEYACRAGTTTPFHFGDSIDATQANFLGEAGAGKDKEKQPLLKTSPVGSFPANAWGLHDMHGNVWQWCQDSFGEYPQKDVIDPPPTTKGLGRVLRGGSWFDNANCCRSASRNWADPNLKSYSIGFRLCFTE
jgi:formylglycine-generating enzyme required for sulfatase activity